MIQTRTARPIDVSVTRQWHARLVKTREEKASPPTPTRRYRYGCTDFTHAKIRYRYVNFALGFLGVHLSARHAPLLSCVKEESRVKPAPAQDVEIVRTFFRLSPQGHVTHTAIHTSNS